MENTAKTKLEIIAEIIEIISHNNLTISEAKEILRASSRKLDNQKVISTSC